MVLLISTNRLESCQNQKADGLHQDISIRALITLWSSSLSMAKTLVRLPNGMDNLTTKWMKQLLIMTFVIIWENKAKCDRKMVKALDKIPYGEMPK